MKRLLQYVFLLLFPLSAFTQVVRWDSQAATTGNPISGSNGGQKTPLVPVLALPGSTVTFCQSATPGGACNLPLTTYTTIVGGGTCPTATPLTRDDTPGCFATADKNGNFGVFVAAGAAFEYQVTTSYGTAGPFYANAPGGGSGGGVSQLLAGTNITLSPTDGLGIVTINSTGGGGTCNPSSTLNFLLLSGTGGTCPNSLANYGVTTAGTFTFPASTDVVGSEFTAVTSGNINLVSTGETSVSSTGGVAIANTDATHGITLEQSGAGPFNLGSVNSLMTITDANGLEEDISGAPYNVNAGAGYILSTTNLQLTSTSPTTATLNTSQICTFATGCGATAGVSSINTVGGAFTFSFSGGAGSCSGTTCTFTGSGSGGGSVTNFIANTANWPTWLVPTVTLSTSTPTLAVAASAIPNSALTNSAITLGGTSVSLGGTISTAPSFNAGTATLAANSSLLGGVALSGICQTGGAGCPTSGTGISGQASGVIPLASTATTIAAQSHLDDGNTVAGTITSTEPIALTGTKGGALTLTAGTAPTAAPASSIKIFSPTGVTAYGMQLPAAQPTSGNTFFSCSAANPSICTFVAGGVSTIGVTTANGVSGTSSGGSTPSLTIALGAITPTTVTASGAISATGYTATGGFLQLTNGTAQTPSANSIVVQAPTTVGTAYSLALPAAAPTAGNLALDCTASTTSTCTFTGETILRGTLTMTTATTDSATITGVTSSSNCTFSPTNSTAAAATTIAFVSSVSANTVVIGHVATTASGGTLNIHCTLN